MQQRGNKRLLFPPSVFLGICFVAGIFLLYGAALWWRGVDIEGYEALMRSADPSKAEQYSQTTEQQRKFVEKEVILAHDFPQRRARLEGKEARLVFERHQKGTELVEYLYDVSGWLQEEVYDDSQMLHHLDAEEVCCDYRKERFIAKNPIVKRFLAPGTTLEGPFDLSNPLFMARAPRATLTLHDHQLRLEEGVTMERGESLLTALTARFIPGEIIFEQDVELEDRLGKVLSDKCTLYFEEQSDVVHHVELEGNIRLLNRSQFALADRLDYYPSTEEILLYGVGPSRVLFYDEGDDMQISAPAMKLRKNQVQGIGDVRFHFADEEKQKFKRWFPL